MTGAVAEYNGLIIYQHELAYAFTNTGSVTIGKLFNLPTVASAGLLAVHTTETITHSIRVCDAAGTVYYIMCTNDATHRTGGA